jgi:hypothetical protein
MQYRKHVDVKDALNPQNPLSVRNGSALPPNEYLAYKVAIVIQTKPLFSE